MHNGCLLLLAFVAVLQPIASYSERGPVDGREERCDYRTPLREPEVYFHGTYRFAKPAVEDRRLSTRQEIREVRRNEVRGETLRTASTSDRRLAESLERNRNTLKWPSKERVSDDTIVRRENREGRVIANLRDKRNRITRERLEETHHAYRRSRQDNSRSLEDGNRYRSSFESRRSNNLRVSVESHRETQRSGNNADAQRTASNGARNDIGSKLNGRRIGREEAQRMDMRRSVSRIQVDRNVDHEVLDRRSRSLSKSGDTVNRAFNNDGSRTIRDENRSFNRVVLRTASARRSVDELTSSDDVSRIKRQSPTYERRNIGDSPDHRNLRDRASENNRDTPLIERARFMERNARLKAVRSVDDRLPQNVRTDSHLYQRASSVQNRMYSRVARSTDKIRSLERNPENRIDSRRSNRARSSERQNKIRNIESDPETIHTNNRAPAYLRDTRTSGRNLKCSALVRDETRNNNGDSCVFDRVRSTEHRLAGIIVREQATPSVRNSPNMVRDNQIREFGRVNQKDAPTLRGIRSVKQQGLQENRIEIRNGQSQAFGTEPTDENRRISRNINSQVRRIVRTDENQRDARNADSRTFRITRTYENRRKTHSIDSRPFKAELTDENRRGARNVDSRAFRTERSDENRRDARNVVFRAFGIERTVENRRDNRKVDSQAFRTERTDENRRDSRTVDSRAFRIERTGENRRDARNVDSRAFRNERTDENRRDARNVDSRALRRERIDENQQNARNVDSRAVRRERTDENQRDSRTVVFQSFRNERTGDSRRETRDFDTQSRSLGGDAHYRQNSRNNKRDARIQDSAPENRRNIQNTERRSANERVISNRRDRSLERESQSLIREIESRLNKRTITRDSRTFALERRVRATENHRNTRIFGESRSSDILEERRVQSRVINLVRDDITDRLNKRDSLDSSASRRETRRKAEREIRVTRHLEAETTRSFNTEFAGKREFTNMFQRPKQLEDEASTMNWQYLFYTLQGLYICGVLIQLMDERNVAKKTRATWWPVPQHLIKVD